MNSVRFSEEAASPRLSERPARGAPAADPAVKVFSPDRLPESLIKDWAELGGSASEPNSFAEAWFVLASFRHLADQSSIRVLAVQDPAGGPLVGIVPVAIGRRYGRIPVRHVRNWSHHHSFLGTPLIRCGRERAFFAALIDHLDQARRAPGFLHLDGIVAEGPVHRGLQAAARDAGRVVAIVHHHRRAELRAGLSADAYAAQAIRKKKRKELKRLAARLGEQGDVRFEGWHAGDPLSAWCDAFITLEQSGWKGRGGSALGCDDRTTAFFREALAGAAEAGRLQMLRLSLDGRPIAMLINFLAPPGSFSFKIAIDEDFSRYSPGVLLEIENLRLLDDPAFGWMDSCAVQDHPMIDSLWLDRRDIVRVSVPLSGVRRGIVYAACRALETASAQRRHWFGR